MSRPTRASIDIDALLHNCRLADELGSGGRLVAVVKANAYGHGALPIAKALEPLVSMLAVACFEEAMELRESGIRKPILLLEGPFQAAEIVPASRHNFPLMLHHPAQVQWLLETPVPTPMEVWLKYDSGMHRLGMNGSQIRESFAQLNSCSALCKAPVIATHYASADQLDSDFTRRQWQSFQEIVKTLHCETSLANSAAILGWPGMLGDYLRPGIMLYGSSPFATEHAAARRLHPVMSLTSEVISLKTVAQGESVGYGGCWRAVRDSQIAIVAIGYGDGYPRHCPTGTPVMIEGHRAPLAGRVSMDMIAVDVTGMRGVRIGSQVELWGGNLPVAEIARHSGTIGYELLTGLSARIPRHYIRESEA